MVSKGQRGEKAGVPLNYKNKLKTLMEEPTDEQTEEITKVQNKINELTDAINNL